MKFNLNNVTASVKGAFYDVSFKIKKHSPEILVVSGVVGTVASAVLACKATTKVNFVLEETKRKVDIVHNGMENGEVLGILENGETGMVPYSQEDGTKDLVIVYANTGFKLAKLYAPSIILGTVSLAAILSGHNILRKRNLALAAAYTAVDNGFKSYRKRVVERFGDKLDKELFYNIKAKEVEEVTVDDDGNEHIEKKVVEVADPVMSQSPFTFCFDETARGWVRDAEDNKFFLLRQQDYANDRLKSKKRVFLNEVLEMLGIDPCRAGQTVGWVYDENNPVGDNYIDFGIFDINNEASRNFVNGLEKSVWLTFNVDGDIMHTL